MCLDSEETLSKKTMLSLQAISNIEATPYWKRGKKYVFITKEERKTRLMQIKAEKPPKRQQSKKAIGELLLSLSFSKNPKNSPT